MKFRIPLFKIEWKTDKNGKVKVVDAYAPIARSAKYVKDKVNKIIKDRKTSGTRTD